MRRTRSRLFLSTILASTVLAVGTVPGHAFDWDNDNATNDWFHLDNWDVGGANPVLLPTMDDTVTIDAGVEHPVIIEDATTNGSAMARNLHVGADGVGILTIRNGGTLSTEFTGGSSKKIIGDNSGSSGTVTVTGLGSTWTYTGGLTVGGGGQGTMIIEAGGTAEGFAGYIGESGIGEVTVTGAGAGYRSTWTTTGILHIGEGGGSQGSLTIADGALVTTATSRIGNAEAPAGQPATSGTVLVTDDGSELRIVGDDSFDGDLRISESNNTTGMLTVAAGGLVSNTGVATLGYRPGSSGEALVTGTGSMWASGGDLTIGRSGSGILTVSDGGTVEVGAGGAGTVYLGIHSAEAGFDGGIGTLNIGAAYDPADENGQAPAAPGTLNAAVVSFGDGAAPWGDGISTLVFNHTADDYQFDPALLSTGLGTATIEVRAGTTILTADSSAYTSTTNIHGGMLLIGQSGVLGGQINVLDGGTFGGNGTGGDVTVMAGSTLAPGMSIGTLSVGTVLFDADAVFEIEVDGSSADLLQVADTANLAGTVHVVPLADIVDILGTEYVILEADEIDAVDNEFDSATSDFAFLAPTLRYVYDPTDPDQVILSLDLIEGGFGTIGRTPNQIATGDGIFSGGTTHPLFPLIVVMNEEDALDAFDQLSGEIHSSLKGALVENGQKIVEAVNDRIHNAFAADNANTSVAAYGDTADPANGFWMTGYGDWMTTDATFNTHAFDNDLYGVVAGVDHRFGEYGRLGILGGYSRTNTSIDALASQADADSYTVGLYGGADNGNAALSLGALYTWHSIDSTRYVTNPVTEMLNADYDARSFQLFAEAGYKATMDRVTVEPFAGVSYINLNTDSFSETGGMTALSASSQTTSTTFTTLGLRSSIELTSNVSTRGMVGWRHAFGDVDPSSTFTIGGSGPFSILGAPIAQDAAVLEAGIDIAAGENVTIGASYEGQYGDGAIANGFNARLLAQF